MGTLLWNIFVVKVFLLFIRENVLNCKDKKRKNVGLILAGPRSKDNDQLKKKWKLKQSIAWGNREGKTR